MVALAAGSLVVNTATLAHADVASTFELEGDQADGAAASPDWSSLFTSGGQTSPYSPVPVRSSTSPTYGAGGFFRDFTPGSTADSSTFATGSKDTLDITPGWQCKKSNNVTDKGDIQNTFMTTYRDSNNHLIVYAGLEKNAPNGNNNMAVWLLRDGTVGCTAGTGNTAFTGHHQNGDVLLVAAFLNGGSNPVINAYEWDNGALNTTALGTGGKCGVTPNLCAITNDTDSVTTTWITDDKVLGTGHTLQADQFYEMGADLTALGLSECFANYLANTRSSQELGATLYDFAGGSAPTCGSLSVHKYIDADKSGTKNTGDVNSGTVVTGWSFTVKGPSPSTTTVCSGTTNSSGDLVCSTGSLGNLTPGTYTVTETQQSGFFATDPGGTGTFNTAASPSKTVVVSTAGGSIDLGNTCFVDKTFRITGVPTGSAAPASLTVSWSKSAGDGTATSGTVTLTDAGNTTLNDGIYQGVLNDTLAQDAVISWSWYITGDSAHSVVGQTNESLSSGAYPTCAKTNTVSFPFATLNGTKYKDIDVSGTNNAGDLAGAGFTFQLKSGSTVLATTTSSATGTYSFSNVAPGTYTVHEVQETGWVQTEPLAGTDRSVTVNLGDTSVTIGAFGNTPLSNISASFVAQALNPGTTTPSTQAAITCKDANNNTVGSQTGNTASATGLYIGTYTCTIVITDP